MVGLTMRALIVYYEKTADPRIPPMIKTAADWLWANAWVGSNNAFWYENWVTDPSQPFPGQTVAPDLNLLIAPAYAWLYRQTGDATYQSRGDQIFSGGVLGATTLGNGKQFDQNYIWSFDYVKWRTPSPSPSSIKINFQPAASAVPSGYMADTGLIYGDRGNGYTYGWDATTNNTVESNSANSPDKRYDTLNHLWNTANATWEIAVPNGTYTVQVVSGDALWYDSVYKINVEGILTVNGTPTSATRWIEGTQTVTVNDGKLTVNGASGNYNNKICFIDIYSN